MVVMRLVHLWVIVLRADGRSALMAARNVEDGISFLQAGESALLELAALNTRLRELAVQKLNANGTFLR